MFESFKVRKDQSEDLIYDTPDLPIRVRQGRLSLFDQYAAQCHWHNDFEFLWTVDGPLSYFVNGKTVRLEKGMGIFVNSGRLHYGFSEEHSDCVFRFVVADPALLMGNTRISSRLLLPLIKGEDYRLLYPEKQADGVILNTLQKIFYLSQQRGPGYELDILGQFSLLTAELCRLQDMDRQILNSKEQDIVKDMVAYIQEHLEEKITLASIAQAGAVCQSRCSSLFRTYLNQSPIQYLQRARVSKGIRLLADDEKSITDIALACGFNSASYFIETFRQATGMTPLAFRKKKRLDNKKI